MDVKYPICCGVDVHKTFLVAVIIKDAQPKPQYIKKRFSTFNKDLLEFKKWLIANDCLYLCMESTGKYWVPVFNILEDKINVTVAKKYERIAKRRGKKRAIIAIARMILIAIYHIIQTGEVWNPSDLQAVEMPTDVKVKLAKSDLQRAIKTLISNGISIEDITSGYLQT